jgi:hypothetical protein
MNGVCCVSFFLSVECEVQALRGLQFHHQCDLLAVGTWSFIFWSKVEGIKEDKKFQPFSPLHCLLQKERDNENDQNLNPDFNNISSLGIQ